MAGLAVDDTRTLARRSAHALGWSWAGAVVRALLQVLIQIALARLVGPEAFGQAAAALLVIGLASLVAEWGLASALIQRAELRPGEPGIALGVVLLVASIVGLGIALAAEPIARLLGGGGSAVPAALMWGAAPIVPLQAASMLPAAVLQRRLQAKRLQAIQLVAYVLGYGVLGLGAAALGAGAWSIVAAYALHVAVTIVASASAVAGLGWRPRWGSAAERAKLTGYGARIVAGNLVNWVIESIDRLVVGHAGGPAALGPYAAAANLARAPVTLLVSAAQPVAFATAAQLQAERERLARGWLAMLSLALLAALPLFVFLAWHGPAVVLLLFGTAWQAAAAPFSWLCLGVPFFVMAALTGPLLRGVDAVGAETRVQAVALLVVVVLLAAVLLAGRPGGGSDAGEPAGALPLALVAAVVSVGSALRAAGAAAALVRRTGVEPLAPWRCWGGGLVLAGVVLAACAAVAGAGLQGLPALAVSALIALPLLVLVLRLSRGVLFGAPLRLALGNRRGDSAGIDRLCRWCGIEAALAERPARNGRT